ncbi:MAG: tetratricopeptide repeat protein [Myxococcales bacterium]|nr:tetratricopeptide repeat protein [Myxococcales bacterium]
MSRRFPYALLALALVGASTLPARAQDRALERWLASATRALDANAPRRARPLLARAAARAPSDPRVLFLVARLLPDDLESLVHPSDEVLDDARWLRALAGRVEVSSDERAQASRLAAWSDAICGERAAAALPLAPQDRAGVALLRRVAALALRRGAPDEALLALRRAHGALPQDPEVLRELAALLVARGRPAEAVQLLTIRLRVEPGDLESRRDLGLALLADGREGEALAILEDVARQGQPADLLRYAAAALEAGRLREAASAAARAASRSEGSARQRAYAVRGLALLALGQREAARDSLRLAPDDARAREALRLLEARAR